MSSNNDDRIMTLKKEIAEKRNNLDNTRTRFSPRTNCMLELDGVKYNLNVNDMQTNRYILMKLALLKRSIGIVIDNYDVPEFTQDDITISGYPLSAWLFDVQNKIKYDSWKEDKKKLDSLEKQLTKLLSNDKQTELMIDELASTLNKI